MQHWPQFLCSQYGIMLEIGEFFVVVEKVVQMYFISSMFWHIVIFRWNMSSYPMLRWHKSLSLALFRVGTWPLLTCCLSSGRRKSTGTRAVVSYGDKQRRTKRCLRLLKLWPVYYSTVLFQVTFCRKRKYLHRYTMSNLHLLITVEILFSPFNPKKHFILSASSSLVQGIVIHVNLHLF